MNSGKLKFVAPEKRAKRKVSRQSILSRDFYICQCCCVFDEECEAHHIHPLFLGGEDEPNNMITLCYLCHKFAPNEPDEFLEYQKSGGAGYWAGLDKTVERFAMLFPDMTIAEFNERRPRLRVNTYEVSFRQYEMWAAFNAEMKRREKEAKQKYR